MLSKPSGSAEERRLTRLYRELRSADRETLVAFAEFLAHRTQPEISEQPLRQARPLPRPETESVVGAIKRLSQTYDMLDRGTLLHETSALMSAHVLQGRDAREVIDELEALFFDKYQKYQELQRPAG